MGTLILVFSIMGFLLLVRKTLALRWEFIPVFVFSSIACLVFLCGLCGVLRMGSLVICAFGVLAFIWIAVRQVRAGDYPHFTLSLFPIIFLLGTLCFFIQLSHCEMEHYDNFSHWAVVVKQMLSANAFPAADSALIDFKNYPLGASSFIYFICLFAGHSQQMMLIAQGLLIFSCFYAVFGIISETKRFLLYAFLGLGCACLSFFNITIRINNLLVDFLLPAYTLAIWAAAYHYRKDIKRACIVILPIAGLLTVIKSTGIIFVAFGLLFLLYLLSVNRESIPSRRELWLIPASLLGAILPYLAWNVHMKTTFSGVQNKFDLQQLPVQKTTEQMGEIIRLFLKSSVDLSTRPAIGILAFNLTAIAASIFVATVLHKKWKLWKATIALNIVLLLYYIGIMAMYLFSMPLDEALRLAGFERYACSIVVLFAGGLVLCATVDIENSFYYRVGEVPKERCFYSVASKNQYQKGVLICTAVAVILLMSEYNGIQWNIDRYNTSLPYQVKAITGDRWYPDGSEDMHKYLFYAPDKDAQVTNYYMQYVGRYFLFAPFVDGICLFYEDNMDNLLSNYDYLVVVESDPNARYLLRKHYDVTGQEGIYRVHSANGHVSLTAVEKETN